MARSQAMSTPQASSPNTPATGSAQQSFSNSQLPPSSQLPARLPSPTAALSAIPPSTFDFVPALHQLLSRLLSVPLPPSSSAGREHPPHSYTDAAPLEIQGLAPAASVIKIKLQKARAAVRALPDVERSVEEQQEEIGALEQRVRRLRAILAGLKEEIGPYEVKQNDLGDDKGKEVVKMEE